MNKNYYKSPVSRKHVPKALERAFIQRKRLLYFIRMLFLLRRQGMRFARKNMLETSQAAPSMGYDPELLLVECARCGAPVLWGPGKTTALMKAAGIDPLELDPYCMLLTDACPGCSPGREYHVKIFRLGNDYGKNPPICGHA